MAELFGKKNLSGCMITNCTLKKVKGKRSVVKISDLQNILERVLWAINDLY